MITVLMPSFHSTKLVKERISEINNDTEIIIIENSRNNYLKEELEKKHNNVKVIIPDENLGWGRAINLGIKLSNTNMVFITQPDVKLINDCIEKLKECITSFKDFSILTPYDKNDKIYKNFENYRSYEDEKVNKKFLLKEVDYVDLTWLIDKSKFKDYELWDEKIFLYFEAKDFSKRVKDSKKKIYIVKNINTYHIGSASHDPELEYFSKLNRSWHYNWSRHYFNKKHFGIFFSYRKSLLLLIKLILKFFKALILLRFPETKFMIIEIYGLISAMLGLPSFYRPYKKN